MQNKIKLSKESKVKAIEEIKKFFYIERNEEIGDLAADIILDFIINNIAYEFYNQGIRDAIVYMSDKVEDMYGMEI